MEGLEALAWAWYFVSFKRPTQEEVAKAKSRKAKSKNLTKGSLHRIRTKPRYSIPGFSSDAAQANQRLRFDIQL